MIKTISIKNFKSLKNITFDLPKFAVLVGHNGSGKTNFVNALDLISSLAKGEQIDPAINRLPLPPREVFFDNKNRKLSFFVEMELDGGDRASYSFTLEQNRVDGKYHYKVVKEELINGTKKKPVLERTDRLVIVRSEGGKEVHETQQLVPDRLALSMVTVPEVISTTKEMLSSISICKLGTEYLRGFGQISNVERGIYESLPEMLFNLQKRDPSKYGELIIEIKKIIPELAGFVVTSLKDGRLTLHFSEKGLPKQFSPDSISDGNLRILAIVANVLSAKESSTLVIDELENSFHPTRIDLLMSFLKYVSDLPSEKLQIIITTHNPIVLNHVQGDKVVYVLKKNGKTKIVNPYKNKKVRSRLMESEKGGTKLGELFSSGLLESIFSKN